jgi:hypothetical protein
MYALAKQREEISREMYVGALRAGKGRGGWCGPTVFISLPEDVKRVKSIRQAFEHVSV